MSPPKWIRRILLLVSCVVSTPCLAQTCQQTALANYQTCIAAAVPNGSVPKGVLPCAPAEPQCENGQAACCAGRTSSQAKACQLVYNLAAKNCQNYTVTVTVSGLNGGALVLENNARSPLKIVRNGTFTFAAGVSGSGNYAVTAITQPPYQTCTPINGSGAVNSANVEDITVTCTPNPIETTLTACDLNGCISESQFLSNISTTLQGNVLGYVAMVDQMPPVVYGQARTTTDPLIKTTNPTSTAMAANLVTNVASVSKTLTTVGVLRSLARHGLTIDNPISPYIYADWVQGPNIKTITFKELLTHTAGIRVNCNGSTTTYAVLKALIAAGVNQSDIGVPQYNNCDFAIFRELLPNMENYQFSLNSSQTTDVQRPPQSAAFYIDYMNENVFRPIGVTWRGCIPPLPELGTADILSYPFPAGTTAGTDWGDWTLACGGGGWVLSASDLFDVAYYLANGNVLLTDAEKTQMASDCLGWDCSVRSDCPNPYVCKNGHLDTGSLNVWTYVGIFKCNVPVVLIVNSPLPQPYQSGEDIIGLVNNAYTNAAVAGTPTACP